LPGAFFGGGAAMAPLVRRAATSAFVIRSSFLAILPRSSREADRRRFQAKIENRISNLVELRRARFIITVVIVFFPLVCVDREYAVMGKEKEERRNGFEIRKSAFDSMNIRR